MTQKTNDSGFTLIELLVVIAIIGLLASVVLVSLGSARIKSRDVKRKADLRQLSTAIQLYYDTNTAFPNDDTNGLGDWDPAYKAQLAPFIAKPPIDPLPGRYYGSYRMTWAPDTNCNGRYVLWAYLESTSDPDYGKYTCGFGTNHYFVVIDKY
jgi:prepilin-type N-terminal cleavage/methylation domain-containing protein